jgi:alpha-D-ribose 1-methylphosphonate 5-triphosphate diphosphatase
MTPIYRACLNNDVAIMLHGIHGGRVLLPNGDIVDAALRFDGSRIADVDAASGGGFLDVRGLLVLPGIVDIHGDAFERQLMPRPGVSFPVDIALVDTDRQLLANGITTAFHGITCSWEGGLRGSRQARELIDTITGARLPLHAEHCVHLRFETHHLDAVEEVLEWIETGRVDFLAFNDHVPDIGRKIGNGGVAKYSERAGISDDDFRRLFEHAAARRADVPAAVERIAAHARIGGIRLASHDDETADQRRWYDARGCAVSEFPRTEEALRTARTLTNHVILGAPNVVRGGSHLQAPAAADCIAHGLCDILASDYYYPALVSAAFRLAADAICPLGDAWPMISRNPARAAGLHDRGEIAPGQRADLVLIDDGDPRLPRVHATVVAGALQYATSAIASGVACAVRPIAR